MSILYFLGVAFGELDISPVTVAVMLLLTVFIFAAVGLSTMGLVRSAFDKDEEA